MATDPRTSLLHLLATLSFKLGDYTLASGARSDYYIDCRTTTLHAEGGRLAGLVLYDLIAESFPSAVAVGGLTMGADPLVSNTASASAWAAADWAEIRELHRRVHHHGNRSRARGGHEGRWRPLPGGPRAGRTRGHRNRGGRSTVSGGVYRDRDTRGA